MYRFKSTLVFSMTKRRYWALNAVIFGGLDRLIVEDDGIGAYFVAGVGFALIFEKGAFLGGAVFAFVVVAVSWISCTVRAYRT
jgi:hypothetical protein